MMPHTPQADRLIIRLARGEPLDATDTDALIAAVNLAESCEEDYETDSGSLYSLDYARLERYRETLKAVKP